MNKDKKILYRFIALVVCSLVIGIVMGYFSAAYEADMAGVLGMLLDSFVIGSPYLMVIPVVILIAAAMDSKKAKDAVHTALSEDDEALYEAADDMLEKAVVKTQYSTISGFMLFGVMTSGFGGLFAYSDFRPVMFALVIFMLCLLGNMAIQSIVVKQIKLLNPEKRGNVLDTKFHQEWMDSCDEAEKAQIGFAASQSYQATSKALLIAFLVLVMAGFILPVGPLPVICICTVWLVQYCTYIRAVHQFNKKK